MKTNRFLLTLVLALIGLGAYAMAKGFNVRFAIRTWLVFEAKRPK